MTLTSLLEHMRIVEDRDNPFYLYYGSSQISTFTLSNYLYLSYLTVSDSYGCIKIIFIKKMSICTCHFKESRCSVIRVTPKIQT